MRHATRPRHSFLSYPSLAASVLLLAAAPAAARGTDGLPPEQAPGMFTGGLLSALFTGAPFTGPRLADIVIIGLLVFMLLRLLTGRRAPSAGPDRTARPAPPPVETSRDQPPAGGPANEGHAGTPPSPGPDGREPSLTRVYQAAEATWGGLRSAPRAPGQAADPARPAFASQDEEFLAGAKAVYARVREAMEKGDVSGVTSFVAPEFLGELSRLAGERAARTGGKTSQLLLVEAAVEGRESRDGVTRVNARYEVVAKMPGASGDGRQREVWTFARDEARPGSMWLLAGMQSA